MGLFSIFCRSRMGAGSAAQREGRRAASGTGWRSPEAAQRAALAAWCAVDPGSMESGVRRHGRIDSRFNSGLDFFRKIVHDMFHDIPTITDVCGARREADKPSRASLRRRWLFDG
jgi:hypothetical protein